MLTVDLGNTRTKLRLWCSDPSPRVVAGLDHDPAGGADGLVRWLDDHPADRAALASVADEARTRHLIRLLEERGVRVLVAPEPGVANRTLTPETVGLDRLYAARGALAERTGAAVVCDLGTALTVDAVSVEDGRGVFLGGAIAVGPELAARALAEHTARLPAVAPWPGAPALGRETRAALAAGAAVGIRGAARELVLRISDEADLREAPVFLSGGARAFLLEPESFLAGTGRELVEAPDLVHRGLLAAVSE